LIPLIVWLPGGVVTVYAGGAYPDWCGRCWSSSAVRVRFYLFTAEGPRFAGLWWACQVCDPDRFDGGGDGLGDVGAAV
jgi:hypothetical protein